jgi:hypothetical protein
MPEAGAASTAARYSRALAVIRARFGGIRRSHLFRPRGEPHNGPIATTPSGSNPVSMSPAIANPIATHFAGAVPALGFCGAPLLCGIGNLVHRIVGRTYVVLSTALALAHGRFVGTLAFGT